MKIKNYAVSAVLIYLLISTAQSSSVCASQIVSDEIDKYVLPQEETKIEKTVHKDSEESHPVVTEEQPSGDNSKHIDDAKHAEEETAADDVKNSEEEKHDRDADTVKKTEPVEKQIVPEKKEKPKQEDLSGKTVQTNNQIPAETGSTNEISKEEPVSEEKPLPENKFKTIYMSLTNIYDKCKNFVSGISFDSFTEMKEAFTDLFFPNYNAGTLCCRQDAIIKKISGEKEFLPYYFVYPEPVNKFLERTAFSDNIINPNDYLPYLYTVKNYEVKIEAPEKVVTPQGTSDYRIMVNAPSPKIKVTGKSLFAKLVIDIRNNTLYKYDEDGFPLKAYLIATGARGSRTRKGLRIVTYTDSFPFRGAPNSKRAVDPYSYGPYIFFLNAVNPETGRQYAVDQLLHGNGNEYSIGRKVSHGCVRTNNHVMRHELSKEVKRGDYILLINPDIN